MRVLLTPVPVGYGTTFRCLAVAAECRRRGYDLLFACHPDRHERIQQYEFPVRAIRDSTIDPESSTPAVQQYLDQHTSRMLAHQLEDLRAIIAEFRPDVAVTSHNMVTPIAAAASDTTLVSIFHPDLIGAHSPGLFLRLLAEWLRLTVLKRRVQLQHPVPPAPFGDLSCIPSIPELIHWPLLQPPHVYLRRADAIPVGALLMEDPDQLPDRATLRRELRVPVDDSLVFCTVGGAIARADYLHKLVQGLEQSEIWAIVSVGTRLSDKEVESLNRPRVQAVRFLPDDLRAMKAADALLWHGGHETMLKAVACGIPAVGVPFQFDQDSNAKALERTGAGLRIGKEQLHPGRVADALTSAIKDARYREAAARLAASNRQVGGARRLVDLLEQHVGSR